MKFKVNSIEPQGHITRTTLSAAQSDDMPQIELTMDIHTRRALPFKVGESVKIEFGKPEETEPKTTTTPETHDGSPS